MKTASVLQFHILFFMLWGFLLRLIAALLLQKLHLLRDGVLRFGLFLRMKEAGHGGNADTYICAVRSLVKFVGREKVMLSEIQLSFCKIGLIG